MDNPYKIAIVQHPPVFLNLPKSVELGLKYIAEASAEGAKLIVFPETWLPGYPAWLDYSPEAGLWDHPPAKALFRILYNNSIRIGDEHFSKLQEAAREHECLIVMGAHEKVGRSLYNTMFYFTSDGAYALHRKLMPTYTERLIWAMGDGSTLPVLEDHGLRIGGLICWEHWMPLARAAMHKMDEHIHIAQWPMVKDLHHIASRQYAFEGQTFVIAAGCILSKKEILDGLHSVIRDNDEDKLAIDLIESIPAEGDELILRGGSCVINPDTRYLIEPVSDEAMIIYSELDPARIIEGNLFLDTNGHYSRPDVFNLTVDTRNKENVRFEN